MSKARDLANASSALSAVDATELGYLDGVTSAIQTQVDAKIAKTLTTTTGDIIYASGADTPARLAVGSTNDVLTVAGGVPTWAAPAGAKGYALISTTSLTAASTITVTGLGGYDNLTFLIHSWDCGTASSQLSMRFNSNSGTVYPYAGIRFAAGATYDRQYFNNSSSTAGQSSINLGTLGTVTGGSTPGSASVSVLGANGSNSQQFSYVSGTGQTSASTMSRAEMGQGMFLTSTKITTVSLISSAGNFNAGTLTIYGAV